ncbi:YybH family protein [Pseudonocardia sp. CA-107938]|uniref:YybH family protein n=1 Tax=Pseudonocardia sp. CA-107938 TaxID=3240021 RepID=UPI003D8D0CC8
MTHPPTMPELLPHAFAAAFTSGDPVEAFYEPDAVFVDRSGTALTGAARVTANTAFQALGQPLDVTPRHVFTAGDVALLVVDWTIGEITGTATDVARRGTDGRWRYVVDNPFGTATGAG